ncbi:30748_t:CDS:2, partial [Gigaspora margarita]
TEIGIDVNKRWNLGLLKEKLEQEKTQLTQLQQEQAQEKTQSTQHIQRLNKQITALTILADKRKEDLEQEKQTLITLAKQKLANKKEATELLTNLEENITDLQNKIKKLRDNNQEKEEKTKELLANKNLPQLKQELFSQAQNVYQELRNQIRVATIAWGRKEIGEKLEELEEFFTFSQKETQTPPIVKFSQNTQTSLINENVDKLFTEELGVDTNQKWNLGMLKNKIKQELETAKKNPSTSSRSTQNSDDKDLENTLDNLIKKKLTQLTSEFTNLKNKLTTKLQTQQQTIQETNQKLQESNRKLELTAKENGENEKVLEKLIKEFKELNNCEEKERSNKESLRQVQDIVDNNIKNLITFTVNPELRAKARVVHGGIIIKLKNKYEEYRLASIPNTHNTFTQENNRDQAKITLLEKKLERVRNLIADNQMEKLKRSYRKELRRSLRDLDSATSLKDLFAIPGNRLRKLEGK